ncbi:MAG: NACHT domain-containing protein, partial [Parachlamydiaceae bacterium]
LSRKETVWVVDGLDELQVLPQLQKAVDELMGRENLIVTTRPGIKQHPQVQTKMNFQKHLFLRTYSKKEIHQFIDTYFSDSDLFLELKEKIKKAIETNEQLKELCSIPITLSVICQLVKQGNEEVLIKQNTAELYGCCIVAHLREAYKRQGNAAAHVSDYKIRGSYQAALRFMVLLAHESFKKCRSVSVSKDVVERVLTLQGINQPLDKQSLFEELKAIGLVEVTPFGAEFVHATFQEYFAACFLIESLTKSKKTEAFQNAQAFIEKHKFDFNYHSLFSFMLQQLLFMISQEKEEATKQKLRCLLANSVSGFTQPVEHNMSYKQSSAFLMGISMLNAYAKGIKSGAFTEEDFINNYGNFIETAFQSMLCQYSTSVSLVETSNTLIPSINPQEIDIQFAILFLTLPTLKIRCNVYARLFESIQIEKSHVLPMVWRTIFFIQSIKEFDEQTIHNVHKIAFQIQDKKKQANLFRGVLELTINRIEELILQQILSTEDVAKIQSLGIALNQQLQALSHIVTQKPFELTMVEKIIHCLEISLREKGRSPTIEGIATAIKTYLPHYVFMLFSSPNLKVVVKHCRRLIFLRPLGLSLSSIFQNRTIRPLIIKMDGFLEGAKVQDGRTGRTQSLGNVGYMLQHLLPIIDFVSRTYGGGWLKVLNQLHKSGGNCTSTRARENCRVEVREAVSCYHPYEFIPSQADHSATYFERVYFIYENFFYRNFTSFCRYFTLKERKKLLEWLEPLMQRLKLAQDRRRWIEDFCQKLRDSVVEIQFKGFGK